ncbi:TetR/AcrR family transcriptional regulator [Parendozoicomonas haliclonae]|uniref:HTH-type transcriptional repressor ComR n=1 Tax=Parendozoicomonas haliclonae TaxID=1960125 RepID=A0A1X7AE81_9GAMM|nr:TetR/AcrR family transcriptional regulator [Parendozoicomonas haliclonae]SMA32376.1 HTH-type transcriptional repressor ComR [Parendozoicomonas haliclonae]
MARPNILERRQILARALDPFWRNGYEGTSLKQLEEATGLNPGSLYHHFSNKKDLFRHVLLYYIEEQLLTRLNHYRRNHPPLESLRLFFSTSYRHDDIQDYRCGCLLVMAMTEGHRDTLSPLIREAVVKLEEGFANALAAAGKSKEHSRILLDRYIALQLSGHLQGSRKKLDKYVARIFAALPDQKSGAELV